MEEYDGRQFVGIDLHRRRSVIVRMTPEGQRLGGTVRIDNDPFELARQVACWGESPEVVLEADLEVDAVDPQVHVVDVLQRPLAELRGVVLPLLGIWSVFRRSRHCRVSGSNGLKRP